MNVSANDCESNYLIKAWIKFLFDDTRIQLEFLKYNNESQIFADLWRQLFVSKASTDDTNGTVA